MYEDQTESKIFSRMMGSVPDTVDKREGSIIYDACYPTAIEIMLLYAMCDYFFKNTFGDTAERKFLIERAKERGITAYSATYAKVNLSFTPENINIPIGSRFSYDDVNYTVTEKSDGFYYAICETAGTSGNKPVGNLVAIDYIADLQSALLTEVTVPGEDEEETEAFRKRYLDSFNSQAYGGNIADYREKVNAINGVGGVKVYPAWNGGGTVKIVFMTSEFEPPAAEFVSEVQTKIDPIPNHGEGIGIAPIGHYVTIEGAKNSAITISLNLSFDNNGNFDNHKNNIYTAIDIYFKELNKGWQHTQKAEIGNFSNNGIIVRISQIESRLLDIPGITDVQHTRLNSIEENLILSVDELAVRGEVINGS
ncbi:baseplate J/gp47 family protein [Pectinatus frisingensis]|uniref:baseplate J/gp47 family protein n=1 Tax=Pectinatus frisingensis TaxID=865 RepID=UPI003D80430D